jgi:hypothetical protein
MEENLTVQGIEFRVLRGRGGVAIQATHPLFSGAAELVNKGTAGTFGYRDWVCQVERDSEIELPAFSYIRKMNSDRISKEAAEAWNFRAQSPLPAEVCHIHLDQGYLPPAESWVPAFFLLDLYHRVFEERLGSEQVWLFRFPALFWKPSPGERAIVEPLETAPDTTSGHVDDLADDLQRLGLFDVTFAAERSEALRFWSFAQLLEIQRAGLALIDYLYSPQHSAVRTPPDYVRAIPDSPVGLGVFLSPATPWPATNRHQWLAELLSSVDRGEAPSGYEVRRSVVNGKPRIDAIARVEA